MPLLDASIAFFIWMIILCIIVKSINTVLKYLPPVRLWLSRAISDTNRQTGLKGVHVCIDSDSDREGCVELPQFVQKHPEEFLSYLERYELQIAEKPEISGKIGQVLSISRGRIRKRMLVISFLVSLFLCFFMDINAFSIGSRLFAHTGAGSRLWHIHDGIWGKCVERFLTACMISVGAPYWHNLLEKFITFKKDLSQ